MWWVPLARWESAELEQHDSVQEEGKQESKELVIPLQPLE